MLLTHGATGTKNSSSTQREGGQMVDNGISTSVRIFLGVFIIILAVIGIIGNTIVVTVLQVKNVFTRKTTSLILRSLAAVDLLGSTVDIPLAFSTIVASPPESHLYYLSFAQVVLGPFLFLGYTTCFFLLSFDRNDALRKASNRETLLTRKRIMVVLTIAVACGVAISLLFIFKSEIPNPLLPRQTEPRLLTITRSVLFAAFVIAVSSNIYLFLKIKKLIQDHSENLAANLSQEQIGQWQVKERNISWLVIQVVLVVFLSYVPYTITSTIYTKTDKVDRSLRNAMAICRSLTYLKYAVNAFIFTRLDGKFLRVFFDILHGAYSANTRRIVVQSRSRRVGKGDEEGQVEAEHVGGINEQATATPGEDNAINKRAQSLRSEQENNELVAVSVSKSNHAKNDARSAKVELLLPTISITTPQGKTVVLLKEKKYRIRRSKYNTRRSRRNRSVGVQTEAAV